VSNATTHRVLDLCIWVFASVVVIGGYALAGLVIYRLWGRLSA
jgi:nitrate reductase NapE component